MSIESFQRIKTSVKLGAIDGLANGLIVGGAMAAATRAMAGAERWYMHQSMASVGVRTVCQLQPLIDLEQESDQLVERAALILPLCLQVGLLVGAAWGFTHGVIQEVGGWFMALERAPRSDNY